MRSIIGSLNRARTIDSLQQLTIINCLLLEYLLRSFFVSQASLSGCFVLRSTISIKIIRVQSTPYFLFLWSIVHFRFLSWHLFSLGVSFFSSSLFFDHDLAEIFKAFCIQPPCLQPYIFSADKFLRSVD
jgi:hypothetical protein